MLTATSPPEFMLFLKTGFTEFEIQAEAYFRLREAFPHVRGEIRFLVPKTGKYRDRTKKGARFDLIILDEDENLVCTIEVKDNPKAVEHSKKAHYEKLTGKPNVQISGMAQALDAVRIVKSSLHL